MIHFAIGTKAQLIKTAPVMQRLSERGIAYRYIDLGQHPKTTARLRAIFNLKEPDVSLGLTDSANVVSLKEAYQWTVSLLWKIFRNRRKAFQDIFQECPGVCVIHGDTLSTLVGLICAKRAGMRICHLEAGLRSRHWLHPFPEEMLRVVCMKYADHLAAPTEWAYENLIAMGYGPKTFRTPGNTGAEAIADVLNRFPVPHPGGEPFVLVSIHRVETIMRRQRLKALLRFITDVASHIPVHFVLHEPTERQLHRYGLLPILSGKGIKLTPIVDYPEFLRLLQIAEFVVTDGGSIQEECAYLGTPCLLFRKWTERMEGLGENVCLSGLRPETLQAFVRDYPRYRRPPMPVEQRPSDVVIDYLVSAGYAEP